MTLKFLKSCSPNDMPTLAREILANAEALIKDVLTTRNIEFLKEYQATLQSCRYYDVQEVWLESLVPRPEDEKWSMEFTEAVVRSFGFLIFKTYLMFTYPESKLVSDFCNLATYDITTIRKFLSTLPNDVSKVLVLLWVNGNHRVSDILEILSLSPGYDLKSCVSYENDSLIERLAEWSLTNMNSGYHGGIRTLLIGLNESNMELLLKLVNGAGDIKLSIDFDISSSIGFLTNFIVRKIISGQFNQVYKLDKLLKVLKVELSEVSTVFKNTLAILNYEQFLQLMKFSFSLPPLRKL